MAVIRTQVTIPMDTAITADYASNTWHFSGDADVPTCEAIGDALDTFYTAIAGQLSSLITPSTWVYKHFDLGQPEPRVPILVEQNKGPSTTGSNSSPPEVALCLSFRAQYTSGQPQGRARNRVYIGPLQAGAIGTDGRPSSSLVTALAGAGEALLDSTIGGLASWVVYSPTDATDLPIVQGWVDNEFDTQRRRGRRATARTVFVP